MHRPNQIGKDRYLRRYYRIVLLVGPHCEVFLPDVWRFYLPRYLRRLRHRTLAADRHDKNPVSHLKPVHHHSNIHCLRSRRQIDCIHVRGRPPLTYPTHRIVDRRSHRYTTADHHRPTQQMTHMTLVHHHHHRVDRHHLDHHPRTRIADRHHILYHRHATFHPHRIH